MIDDKLLDRLMEFSTREEQKAFLAGIKYHQETATTAADIPLPIAAPTQTQTQLSFNVAPAKVRTMPNRGLSADMLRMLWTGPVTRTEFYS